MFDVLFYIYTCMTIDSVPKDKLFWHSKFNFACIEVIRLLVCICLLDGACMLGALGVPGCTFVQIISNLFLGSYVWENVV